MTDTAPHPSSPWPPPRHSRHPSHIVAPPLTPTGTDFRQRRMMESNQLDSLQLAPVNRRAFCQYFARVVQEACGREDATMSTWASPFICRGPKPSLAVFVTRLFESYGPLTVASALVKVQEYAALLPGMFHLTTMHNIVLAATAIQHHMIEDRPLARIVQESIGEIGPWNSGPRLADLEKAFLMCRNWPSQIVSREQVDGVIEAAMATFQPSVPLLPQPVATQAPLTPPRSGIRAPTVRDLDEQLKRKRQQNMRVPAPIPPPLALGPASQALDRARRRIKKRRRSMSAPVYLDEWMSFICLDDGDF